MIDLTLLFGSKENAAGAATEFRVFPKQGPARWMLETRFRKPWHLKTWPRANLRARLIYRAAWAMAALGLHLPSRRESFPVAAGSVYAALRTQFADLGVFLGTPGPNRKIVIFAQNPERSVFVKVPLAPASAALAQNEARALTELAKDPDLAGLIPACMEICGHLAVENIETGGAGYGALEDDEVARIHHLLLRRSRHTQPLPALRAAWAEAGPDMPAQHLDDKAGALIADVRRAAGEFLNACPADHEVICYEAHGDFTRWNVLRAKNGAARIIDWELSGPKPMGFDLLHYHAAQDILVTRRAAGEILETLKGLRRDAPGYLPTGHEGLLYIGYYFAAQALYYAAVYEAQRDWQDQTLWQLETWRDCLRLLADMVSSAAPGKRAR